MIDLLLILAQTTTQPAADAPGFFDLRNPLFPLLLMIIVFMFIMSRGRSKERQRYEQMLNSLKRNDRVMTVGGVIGTVVDTREGEVVLKVDETNNVKMRFSRSAIKEVLQPDATGS